MNHRERELFRLAGQIRCALQAAKEQQPIPVLPEVSWAEALKWRRLWQVSQQRGWSTAAVECREELRCSLQVLAGQAQTANLQLENQDSPTKEIPIRDVYEELLALQSEFDNVEWDISQQTLCVLTEPIELEDVSFGSFKIALHWGRLDSQKPYEVIAQDPQRAGSDEEVTHPHVHDGSLCEGDGKAPIRNALRQGRLCDFFLLVRQILQTYNASSAFVRIGEWDGKSCTDCGDSCQRDTSYCDNCNCNLCSECGVSCAACDGLLCNECRGACHGCNDTYCGECVSNCAGCSHSFCQECLTDGQCDHCRKADDDSAEIGSAANAAPETADAAVHSVGVGQALVLA